MLFLIDKPMAEIAFRTANTDPDAELVLIQDGVLLDPDTHLDPETSDSMSIYAVERDLQVRGVTPPDGVEPIKYEAVVEKTLEQGVKSFV